MIAAGHHTLRNTVYYSLSKLEIYMLYIPKHKKERDRERETPACPIRFWRKDAFFIAVTHQGEILETT